MQPYDVLERTHALGSFDTPEGAVNAGSVEKFVLALDDGNAVEAILIGHFGPRVSAGLRLDRALGDKLGVRIADRLPFVQKKIAYETCVSTQVGCALDCTFCASSLVPFSRNLSVDELLREIGTIESFMPDGGKLRKVLFAGVGEPLMNYDNVSEVARRLHARGITPKVNTVGVIPYLERMFEERLPCELAVSIHAPNDALRTEIMPVGKGYPLAEITRVLRDKPPEMFVEAKYLMLDGLNDRDEHADQLIDVLGGLDVTVGLQMYNPIVERDYRATPPERIVEFARRLRRGGLTVVIVNTNLGDPVQGGCGQLRAQVLARGKKKRSRLQVLN